MKITLMIMLVATLISSCSTNKVQPERILPTLDENVVKADFDKNHLNGALKNAVRVMKDVQILGQMNDLVDGLNKINSTPESSTEESTNNYHVSVEQSERSFF